MTSVMEMKERQHKATEPEGTKSQTASPGEAWRTTALRQKQENRLRSRDLRLGCWYVPFDLCDPRLITETHLCLPLWASVDPTGSGSTYEGDEVRFFPSEWLVSLSVTSSFRHTHRHTSTKFRVLQEVLWMTDCIPYVSQRHLTVSLKWQARRHCWGHVWEPRRMGPG